MPEEVTPEVRAAEAEALRQLFEERAQGRSQEAFGAEFGIGSQGMVWQYLNAKRPLNLKAARGFARGLNVDIAAFSKRLSAELAYLTSVVDRPAAAIRAAEGDANVEELGATNARRLPELTWVRAGQAHGYDEGFSPNDAQAWHFDFTGGMADYFLRVRGHSMESPDKSEPTYPDGCLIAISRRIKPVHGDGVIYQVAGREGVTFKRYSVEGEVVWLRPINPDPEYTSYVVGADTTWLGTVCGVQVNRVLRRAKT
jgi:SOS-response transcriptional repressor LexA